MPYHTVARVPCTARHAHLHSDNECVAANAHPAQSMHARAVWQSMHARMHGCTGCQCVRVWQSMHGCTCGSRMCDVWLCVAVNQNACVRGRA